MLGKNHGKSYRGTRIRQPASCQTPESFLYSGYLGKKAVSQKLPTGLLAGRHRRGIRSHSLSLWKAEAWLWGIRAPWDFALLFVWSSYGVLCFETPGRAAAMRPLLSRHAVGGESGKPRMLDFLGEMDLPKKALLSLSSGAQSRRKREGNVAKEALQPSPLPWPPLAPEAQQSQALASPSWSSKVEIHSWETSVPKTASERPHYPILLESTEPQCWHHRLFSYLSSMGFLLEDALCLHGRDRDKCWGLNNEKLPQATVRVLKRERFPSARLKVQDECRRENS